MSAQDGIRVHMTASLTCECTGRHHRVGGGGRGLEAEVCTVVLAAGCRLDKESVLVGVKDEILSRHLPSRPLPPGII